VFLRIRGLPMFHLRAQAWAHADRRENVKSEGL
jgi:hypothetical protein